MKRRFNEEGEELKVYYEKKHKGMMGETHWEKDTLSDYLLYQNRRDKQIKEYLAFCDRRREALNSLSIIEKLAGLVRLILFYCWNIPYCFLIYYPAVFLSEHGEKVIVDPHTKTWEEIKKHGYKQPK